jgi:hypothetical protein
VNRADLDTRPAKNPFDRFPVVAARVESGAEVAEYFSSSRSIFLMTTSVRWRLRPEEPSKRLASAYPNLSELGLSDGEIAARIDWARKWMATNIVRAGERPWFLSL